MFFEVRTGSEYPENTMPAFQAAIAQGYNLIEADIAVTADLRFVLLHDRTINRTARNPDYSTIAEELAISDITFQESQNYDFGIAFHKKYRGTKIPLLLDVLNLVQNTPVKLKLNHWELLTDLQRSCLFDLIRPYETNLAFTCSNSDTVKTAADRFPGSEIHYEGAVSEETLTALSLMVPREKLVVWCQRDYLPETFPRCDARLGLKIPDDCHLLPALDSMDIIGSNGHVKPIQNQGKLADMHNHTKFSHDGKSDLYELCQKQIDSGISVMAVTDHCDIFTCKTVDLVGNARKTSAYIDEVAPNYRNRLKILQGIELGESFWFPEVTRQVTATRDYDVILGSVHTVRYEPLSIPFSKIDFSAFTPRQIADFMDAYFDDMITMCETMDFDVLTHLTNPLRYIEGKYGIPVDLDLYMDKIRYILGYIIHHGIALEINTSSLHPPYGKPMPSWEIMAQYRRMGGYLITLGSDSHVVQNAAYGFEIAVSKLKSMGFHNLFYYKKRNPIPCTL